FDALVALARDRDQKFSVRSLPRDAAVRLRLDVKSVRSRDGARTVVSDRRDPRAPKAASGRRRVAACPSRSLLEGGLHDSPPASGNLPHASGQSTSVTTLSRFWQECQKNLADPNPGLTGPGRGGAGAPPCGASQRGRSSFLRAASTRARTEQAS